MPCCRDAALLRKYDRPGPRYTSYPTAVEFTPAFDAAAYGRCLEEASARPADPVSLYIHLPFCEARCTFCGCMVIATRKRQVAARYLDYVKRELALVAARLGDRRSLVQEHWGGGTPTYFTPAQLQSLQGAVEDHFRLARGAELAIEVDPRATTPEHLRMLRGLGFNRLSMGVQDFTPEVQEAIGRPQSADATRALFDYARAIGFESINIDLVYGLPRQRVETFEQTLRLVVGMRPDRIATYSFAHVPWLRGNQKAIDFADLPSPALKFDLLLAAVQVFSESGYAAIGMDHFALPHDELARAAQWGTLHRNFMGYTTRRAPDTIGIGVSAIGEVEGGFAQNTKKLSAYYADIDAGRLPIERGYRLAADDRIRREVITSLMCNLHVACGDVEQAFGISFGEYFARELAELRQPGGAVADGLLRITGEAIEVLPRGRLLVRNICMVFDRHLAAYRERAVFSRTI
jgi:oxygen-independent coproporphyrinogen-3 oxidase